MMKHYVKKPIPIEAVQFNGDNFRELTDFAGNKVYLKDGFVYVRTLEGDMRMKNATGDYLIKGIKGEFYFCEQSIFEETYEEAPTKDCLPKEDESHEVPSASADTEDDNPIFYSDKPQDVSNLDPEDYVAIVDVDPRCEKYLITYCQVKRLPEVFQFDKEWNLARQKGEKWPTWKYLPLQSDNDNRIMAEANPDVLYLNKENTLCTRLEEGFTAENMARFCKRANEFRKRRK